MKIKEEMEIASKTCTAFDLTKNIDRLKKDDGSIDNEKLEKLILQLRDFGPYYKGVLKTIVENL